MGEWREFWGEIRKLLRAWWRYIRDIWMGRGWG